MQWRSQFRRGTSVHRSGWFAPKHLTGLRWRRRAFINEALPSSRSIVIAYLVCALIWGTTWFAIRVCIGPGGYPTMPAAAIRFGIAALILIPMAWRARPWPTGRAWMWLVIAGVLDAVGYALVYLGEERVPGGLAAVLFGTQPLILALLLPVKVTVKAIPMNRKPLLPKNWRIR